MSKWFNRFRTRSPQRDLTTDLARLGVLDDAFAQVIDSVIQENDLLHLVMREEHAAGAYQVIDRGPED